MLRSKPTRAIRKCTLTPEIGSHHKRMTKNVTPNFSFQVAINNAAPHSLSAKVLDRTMLLVIQACMESGEAFYNEIHFENFLQKQMLP